MGSLENRLSRLKCLIQPPASPEGEAAARRRALVRDILDELARLKASRAVYYRGGKRIEPEDIPGKILERVMNSIRNALGMQETQIAREPR